MSHRFDAPWISGAHLYGDAGLGVIGSLIPATGDNGAGYTYNDLSLPADNAKEICGRITTWPASGTLTAYEDTSFEFVAADGAYSFVYQLYVDGVATGSPSTVSLYVGSVPVEITASLGTASASGFTAGINSSVFIAASLGVATASGFSASISAAGETNIPCSVGNAVASGHTAAISSAFTLATNIGTASASGHSAVVTVGGSFSGSLSDADIDRIVVAVLAALNATTGTRTVGQHLQAQSAVLLGNETGAGTTHVTFTDGTAVVEADVPLPGAIGNRTNVTISV